MEHAITFFVGCFAGGMFGVLIGAIMASGKTADLIRENARLRQLLAQRG